MSSLARKLLAPNALLAIFIAVALGQIAHEATIRARAAERDVEEVQTTSAHLAELSQLVTDIQRNVIAYQIRPDDGFLSPIRTLEAELSRVIAETSRVAFPPRGTMLWREFVINQELLKEARGEILAARRRGVIDSGAPVFAKWHLVAEQSASLLADVITYNTTRLDQTTSALADRRARWLTTLAVIIACSIALIVLSSANLTRLVLRPLGAMTATAERIAAGREKVQVSGEERADEIGVLARAFNRMTTHLVDANAKLTEAVRARDEFLSIASHELKTPLSSVKLQLQIERRRLGGAHPGGGADGLPKWLAVSLRQVDRLESLIASLLDVTRLRAGQLDLRREDVDLAALVASVVERFSADFARSGTAARLELEHGAAGRWDPERIDQVVTNLLANVVKYAPGAPVEIAVEKRDGHAVLRVRDHGPGFTEELKERAFHAFERASTSRGIGGLGLGLYISSGIVAAHRGTISIDSQPGTGAEITVRLPLEGLGDGELAATEGSGLTG
jgi:signal transduction histidine kinase